MRGFTLYEGPSNLDGAPIVAIATMNSSNSKTGPLTQVWILRSDVAPVEAAKSGLDASICGDCRHRPTKGDTCYVILWQAPAQIWRSYKAGTYKPASAANRAMLRALPMRMGAYGDPAAVPIEVWRGAAGSGALGYTHQWRTASDLRGMCMASVDDPEEAAQAQALGWRTFRVKHESDPLLPREIICPATLDRGRTFCMTCRQCDGTRRSASRPQIVVDVHGPRAKRFLPLAS